MHRDSSTKLAGVLLLCGCQLVTGLAELETKEGDTVSSSSTSGGGGTGGQPGLGGFGTGGIGGPDGGGGSTSSTNVGGAGEPGVFCGNGAGRLVPCATGEVCCLSTISASRDHCSSNGCERDEYTLVCDEPSDCPGGVCCTVTAQPDVFLGVQCESTCDPPEHVVCATERDCDGACEPLFGASFAPRYADAYKVCEEP